MKTNSTSLILSVLLLWCSFTLLAQDSEQSQAYWVHEDPVYPSMVLEYEEYCATLVENCKKYNVKKANWITISTDDLRYFHLSPIKSMADLDISRFSVLQKRMGSDEFNELFDNFDNCYDTHTDYIIHLDKELSYMPEGPKEELEFRKLQFWYSTPQNFQKILDLAKSFKELYTEKNAKEYYSLYRSGFGASGQFIMLAISAKSAEDYERIFKETRALLGEERKIIYDELLKSIIRVETLNGYMRSDLSYTPK